MKRIQLLVLISFVFIVVFCSGMTVWQKKKVLIIGDSISIGYTPYVTNELAQEAEVVHNIGNARHTGVGLANLATWLGQTKWDVIHFNWGLWDLCYRHPDSKEQGQRDKRNGKVEYTVEQYAANLDSLVNILTATGAKLIFATTTVVPPNEVGRREGDDVLYNKAALEIMRKYKVNINDLYSHSVSIHPKYKRAEGDVHYTAEGYKKLAAPVTIAIRKALN